MSPADANKLAAEFCAFTLREEIAGIDAGAQIQLSDEQWATDEERIVYRESARALMVEMYDRAGVRACRNCGCTEAMACPQGCAWVEETLCSSCVGALVPASAPDESRIVVVPR